MLPLGVTSPLYNKASTHEMGTAVDSSGHCGGRHGGTDGREGVRSNVGDIPWVSADIRSETDEAAKMYDCMLE